MRTKLMTMGLSLFLFLGCTKEESVPHSRKSLMCANEKYLKDMSGHFPEKYNNSLNVKSPELSISTVLEYSYESAIHYWIPVDYVIKRNTYLEFK